MGIPVVAAWPATICFLTLAYPCLARLGTLNYRQLGPGVRQADLASLLMTVAMAAMVSPVGFPVPVAGWQAVFVVTACWFTVSLLRARPVRGGSRRCDLHHGVSAVAMVYMLAAMPHGDAGHRVWPTMVDPATTAGFAVPVLAALGLAYFAADGAVTARGALRARRAGAAAASGTLSRAGCRVVMSAGMAAMFAAGLAV
ncbi:DUF5134 domain-containing protein [Saccharomonospora piscinae]|uniref:DUF5134 domain-containing protein n=1 Tax=Saccharomonospora piscinae TaxID=687388 RepID=UPI000462ECF3|nr:DUF5134 domain-containing protein [Saccharomonospora piscinae]